MIATDTARLTRDQIRAHNAAIAKPILFRYELERFNRNYKTLLAFAALVTGKPYDSLALIDLIDESVWNESNGKI